MIQAEMGNISNQPSLCRLLYDSSVLLYRACLLLTNAGRGVEALSFINWNILALERFLSLQTAPSCRLYFQLYDLVVTISLENGTDQIGNTAVDRASQKINELQAVVDKDPKSFIDLKAALDAAQSWISEAEKRLKFASGLLKIEDVVDRSAPADRLSAFVSIVSLPLLSASAYYEQMTKALTLAPSIIKSVISPGATSLDTEIATICDDIRRLLELAFRCRQYNVSEQIFELCGDTIKLPNLQPILKIARLGALASHPDPASESWRLKLDECMSGLLSDPVPSSYRDIAQDALQRLYECFMKPWVEQHAILNDRADTNAIHALLLHIADLWISVSNYDPTSLIRYTLELARRLSPSAALRDTLRNALAVLIDYRCQLNEHERRCDVDLIHNPASVAGLACLHVDLLMSYYRMQIQTQSISSCIKSLLDIKADRLSQAIFWLQAAITRPSDKAEARLARVEALLLESDDDVTAEEEATGRPVPVWVGTTRLALQVRKGWRLYGKLADQGASITSSDCHYKGLGVDLHGPGPYIVSDLEPNQSYIFAYRTAPSSTMSALSRVIRSCLPLPSPLIWAYLSQAARQLKFPTLAYRAARRAIRIIEHSGKENLFPLQYHDIRFPVLSSSALAAAPSQFIHAVAVSYHILSETLQLPSSLSMASTHIRSLEDSEWYLIRRAHWLQLALQASMVIDERQLVFDSALSMYTSITPILDRPIVAVFIIPCLEALFHIGSASWPKSIAIVTLRMATVLVRLFDNINQPSQSLMKSDLAQLLGIECREREALRALLARSSSSMLRDSVPKDTLQMLNGADLSAINNMPDLPIGIRALLCLEAANRTSYDSALEYLPKAIESNAPTPSALSIFVECMCIWGKYRAQTSATITGLGWEWQSYRFLGLTDLSLLPSDDIKRPVPINRQFWERLRSCMELAHRATCWQLLHLALRLMYNAIIVTTQSPEQLTPIHDILTAMSTYYLNMIESIRSSCQQDAGDSDVVLRPGLHLSWGLRYSTAQDLVSQPEWRTSLWFMPVSVLDLDLVYAVLAPTLWTLFRVREWSALVRVAQRFDALTQANWARTHLHYVQFAQQQLLDAARARHDVEERELHELDLEMENTKADSARRKAAKRSRLSKQEEDERLAAAVALYEAKRKELVERESQSKSELDLHNQVLRDLNALSEDVRRDYPISSKKLDLARQAFVQAVDKGSKDPALVIAAYEKAIKTARAKQETIILSRALLDLGDAQYYFGQHESARRTWTVLVDCLSVKTMSELGDRKQLLRRIGFWNCIYGAIGQYRLSRQADVSAQSNSARVCSALAWAVLAMTQRHPCELIHLVPTYNRPEPVIPGLDLTQRPDRVRYADLIDTFMFAAQMALRGDRPLEALAPIVIVLDAARSDSRVTIEALALKAEVCLALGQISEAVSLMYRLLRCKNLPMMAPSFAAEGVAWRNDVLVAGNDECIRSLCKEELPESLLECIRHAYGRLLMFIVSLGRYECFDLAKKVLEKFPLDLARLYLERGCIAECIQLCDDLIATGKTPWASTVSIQLDAMQSSAINSQLGVARQAAMALQQHANAVNDRRLERRSRFALIEADLVSGIALDAAADRYRSAIDEGQDESNDDLPDYIVAVLAYAAILLQQNREHDLIEAVSRLETMLERYLSLALVHGMMLPLNRYHPALRNLVNTYVVLSIACERHANPNGSGTAAANAAFYLSMMPYQDNYLEAIVAYRQVVSGTKPNPELALSCVNLIITGCGHEPRFLRRAVIALSKQYADPNTISQCLAIASNVTACGRRLQRNMFELGATASPTDKLDTNVQRDLRDVSLAFAVQVRAQVMPNIIVTTQLIDSIKKDLPKISTLDVIQLLVALRHDDESSWCENRLRRRHMQTLHTFLRDNLAPYRNTCCINKIEPDSFKSPVSATTLIMAWEKSPVVGEVMVRFVAGSLVGVGIANCAMIARVYRQAGTCRLAINNANSHLPNSTQIFGDIFELIRKAFNDTAMDPISETEISADMAGDIQRLFDVDGVQMVDNNVVLLKALSPILQRTATKLFA